MDVNPTGTKPPAEPSTLERLRQQRSGRVLSLVAATVMFGCTVFAAICLGAALLTLEYWGVVPRPVLIAGIVSTAAALGSGIFLFRWTRRWP